MHSFLMFACTLLVTIGAASASATHFLPVVSKIDHPRYAFNYAVRDPYSKDNKAQWEIRDSGIVKGSYSLAEPDGTIRVVDYTADDLRGFNAVVKNIGLAVHPPPLAAKSVAPVTAVVGPVGYGFGATPIVAHPPKVTSVGHWSLPWDPFTHSYGGWVPLTGGPLVNKPFVTIYSKQIDRDGNLHKWITGPIPFHGGTVVIKKKH